MYRFFGWLSYGLNGKTTIALNCSLLKPRVLHLAIKSLYPTPNETA